MGNNLGAALFNIQESFNDIQMEMVKADSTSSMHTDESYEDSEE